MRRPFDEARRVKTFLFFVTTSYRSISRIGRAHLSLTKRIRQILQKELFDEFTFMEGVSSCKDNSNIFLSDPYILKIQDSNYNIFLDDLRNF